jgi:hypothetical protein
MEYGIPRYLTHPRIPIWSIFVAGLLASCSTYLLPYASARRSVAGSKLKPPRNSGGPIWSIFVAGLLASCSTYLLPYASARRSVAGSKLKPPRNSGGDYLVSICTCTERGFAFSLRGMKTFNTPFL